MGTRRKAREAALQFLFQEDFTEQGIQPLVNLEDRFALFCELYPVQKSARPYTLKILQGTADNLARIDEMISTHSAHWRLGRIAGTDRNLLRVAVFEMLFASDTPHQVVINEAVEIAKRFGTEDSPSFVNGVLDAVRTALQGS